MEYKLTNKQEIFCREYLIDFNASRAARAAGYSKRTAHRMGAENMQKPAIQQKLKELIAERNERLQIDADEVLQELQRWAFGDFTEVMHMRIEDIKKLPLEIRRLITGFKSTISSQSGGETGESGDARVINETVEIKFVDKQKAIDMIAKHIGFYEKDNTQKKPEANINNTIDVSNLDTETLRKLKEAGPSDAD